MTDKEKADKLAAALVGVLRHVEDETSVRVGNQCTLCYTFKNLLIRQTLRDTGYAEMYKI